MTTGRINQIALRRPNVPKQEERPRGRPRSRLIDQREFNRQFLPRNTKRRSSLKLRLFAHYPAPRFRGRDSRGRPIKDVTPDQLSCRSDSPQLSPEPRDRLDATATFAEPQNVGTTPSKTRTHEPVFGRPRGSKRDSENVGVLKTRTHEPVFGRPRGSKRDVQKPN